MLIDNYISIKELCAALGISRNSVYLNIRPMCQQIKMPKNPYRVRFAFSLDEVISYLVNEMEFYKSHTYIDMLDYSLDEETTFVMYDAMNNAGTLDEYKECYEKFAASLSEEGKELLRLCDISTINRKRLPFCRVQDRDNEIREMMGNHLKDKFTNYSKCDGTILKTINDFKLAGSNEIAYRKTYDINYLKIRLFNKTYYMEDSDYANFVYNTMSCPMIIALALTNG